jgi:hypothetical protein
MRPLAAIAALVLTGAVFAGCGPTCQSSCTRIWGPGADNCGLERPGLSFADAFDRCVKRCELALKTPGEVGSYDPDQVGAGRSGQLENERQAALWMQCVEETSCNRINDGHCAPH